MPEFFTAPEFFIAADGTRLAYDDLGAGLPLLCLSGLTRTMGDFEYLRPHLPALRLIRMDYRGRGASGHSGAASYTVAQEGADALALLDHLGLPQAAILGTSRGGLIGMYLASTAKPRVLGLCLNDVGPVIEKQGLTRIFDYLGTNPTAKTHAELAAKLPSLMAGFSHVPPSRWLQEAQLHYTHSAEGLRITYDPDLRQAFLAAMGGTSLDLWPLFDACAGLPLALLRGENSDLLSLNTAAEMRRRRPDMLFASIPNRAHIPFLDENESVALIHAFLAKVS
jgi:pimeloyl-ACP methyl ester carboxylesterase